MSILIWITILLYLKNKLVSLRYIMYTHYRYQPICEVIAPNAPSQEVGHWSGMILLQVFHLKSR